MTNKVYNKVLLNKKLLINFNNINNNLLSFASSILKTNIEGKCVNEGFIKPDSINIINYSTGELFTNKVEIVLRNYLLIKLKLIFHLNV